MEALTKERWFVVSESELLQLQHYTTEVSVCDYDKLAANNEAKKQAEAACRARPVPEWATHFVDANNYVGFFFGKNEEIKR